jgi:hypothetical protein
MEKKITRTNEAFHVASHVLQIIVAQKINMRLCFILSSVFGARR